MGTFKPKVSFSDFPERSQMERLRGWAYVLGLPICLFLNFIIGFLLPKTLETLLSGSLIVALSLGIGAVLVPRNLFKKEIARMNAPQLISVNSMLNLAGRSMIYSSMALLYLTETIIWINSSLILVGMLFIVSIILMIVSYDRHRKSSIIAQDLAKSLRKSKWLKGQK